MAEGASDKINKANQALLKQLELLEESASISQSSLDSLKEALGIQQRRSTTEADLLKTGNEINRAIQNQEVGLESISSIQNQIAKNQKLLNKGKLQEKGLIKSIEGGLSKQVKDVENISSAYDKSNSLLQKQYKALARGEAIDANKLERLKKVNASQAARLDIEFEALSPLEKQLVAIRAQSKALTDQQKLRKKELDNEKEIEKNLGVAGGLLKGISKIPILGDVIDAEKGIEAMKNTLKEGGTRVEALSAGFNNLGAQLVEGLLNPANLVLGAITMMGKVIMDVDKQTGEFAKSMNLSYNEALATRKELTEIGRLSGDSALNTRALGETLGSVNKALGTTGKLSESDLKTFTKLREQAGMSNEEIMGMQKFSMVMGGDLKKNTVNFQAQAKALSMSKGTAVNVKSLMADMSKVSSRTKLSIEGGAEGLATAAVNAKLMGGNLEQVASIADSLLNFESSISNELEAELLLGKDINLEKARTAALNNDMATVAAEITKQAGTAAEFGAMNRIQQEGLAKAMGMSADQLGDMLFEQEALKSIGQSLNEEEQKAFDAAKKKYGVEEASRMLKSQAQGEGLQGLLDQQSAQEEFNMAIEKAKEIFVTIAQDILPAIKLAMTPILFIIQAISEGIQMFVKGLKEGNPLAIALAGVLGAMAIPALISAVGAIMSTFALIPLGVGIPLGVAAVAGMYSMANKAKSVKDGVIDPKGGIVISGEKGSIQLNKDDSVVAGTDLFGGKKGGSSQPTQGGGDMSAVISAINTLSGNLNAIASRPIEVSIDGNKVITATTDQKPNETGGAIRKNSYQVQ
jgi:hypothetical protein